MKEQECHIEIDKTGWNDPRILQKAQRMILDEELRRYNKLITKKYCLKVRIGGRWHDVIFINRMPWKFFYGNSYRLWNMWLYALSFFPLTLKSQEVPGEPQCRMRLWKARYFKFVYFLKFHHLLRICRADDEILKRLLDSRDLIKLDVVTGRV